MRSILPPAGDRGNRDADSGGCLPAFSRLAFMDGSQKGKGKALRYLLPCVIAALLAACGGTTSFGHAGWERDYVLHVPEDIGEGAPLVVALHGGGGRARGFARYTGLRELADEMGFVVVFPQGLERRWHDSYHLEEHPEMAGVDDQGFIIALTEMISAEYGTRGVYVTGMSNGGMFLQELLIANAESFDGGASVVAQIRHGLQGEPSRPLPLLFMNGTEDPLVPYGGGYVTLPWGSTRGRVLSTDECVELWVSWNALSAGPEVDTLPDADPNDGAIAVRLAYGPEDDTPVVLYRIEGGGHTLPGGRQYLPTRTVGHTCRDFDGARAIAEFFMELSEMDGEPEEDTGRRAGGVRR